MQNEPFSDYQHSNLAKREPHWSRSQGRTYQFNSGTNLVDTELSHDSTEVRPN